MLHQIEPVCDRALCCLLRKGEAGRNSDLIDQDGAWGMLVAVDPVGLRSHGGPARRRRRRHRLLHDGRESVAEECGQGLHVHRS